MEAKWSAPGEIARAGADQSPGMLSGAGQSLAAASTFWVLWQSPEGHNTQKVLAGGCLTTGRPPPISPPPRSVPQAALSQAGKVGLLRSGIAAVIGPPVAAVVVLRPRCEFRVSRHGRLRNESTALRASRAPLGGLLYAASRGSMRWRSRKALRSAPL